MSPEDDAAPPRPREPAAPVPRTEIPRERVERYLALTDRALEEVTVAPPEPSHHRRVAEDFLRMARDYHADARHFLEEGDLVLAYGAVNYAHGWLDAGARLGLFDVGGDDQLFTLSE